MRILVLTDSFLPNIGGAELAIHNVCEGIASLNHQVLVGTLTRNNDADLKFTHAYGIRRYYTPVGVYRIKINDLWFALCISIQIKLWKPDAIIANFAWPTGYASIKARGSAHIPILVVSHGADIQTVPAINYGFRLDKTLNHKVESVVRKADGLIAISQMIYDEYLSIGASSNRIRLIPNAINYELLNQAAPNARKYLRIPANRKVVLAIGRNHPKKGFSDLIKMMPQVASKVPEALLLIVGKGVINLAAEVDQQNLHESIKLYNEVLPVGVDINGDTSEKSQEITIFYKAADIYAMPSIVEGLPLVGLEAMAAGLPIVAASAPGARDIVQSGENGLLTAPGDKAAFAGAMIDLLCNNDQRKKMGMKSSLFSSKYDRNVIAKQFISYILELT